VTDVRKPTLAELNACEEGEFVAVLGPLFEHSPWVAGETFGSRPFATPQALHAALCDTMRRAPASRQLGLVRAHPDLAGRMAGAGEVTASSAREQRAAGLDRLGEAEAAEIGSLNARYRARFGFPFVICARLSDKDRILSAMRERVSSDPAAELSTALSEIAKIAMLRLDDAISHDR
jgi:2-oxo-4-hydroxy-4-carboxy-5-ureidoimidazoline decarboxylase